MRPAAKADACVFVLFFVIGGVAGTARAKSVYAITYHSPSTITAYDVNGVQIEYQTAQNLPHHSDGAVRNVG